VVAVIDTDQVLSELNELQLVATTHWGTPLLVKAGPGTGKTKLLISRIAWLLNERQLTARGIYAVTFTKDAAGVLRSRIEETVGAEEGSLVNISTIHSLAYRICSADAMIKSSNIAKHPSVAEEEYARDLLWESIQETGYQNPTLNKNSSWKLLQQWKIGDRDPQLLPDGFYPVVERYQEALHEARKWDMADLIPQAMIILDENTELASAFNVTQLLIDEFQDTTVQQYEFLRKLLISSGNLDAIFAVGAEAQSIYGFRNANFQELSKRFFEDFPDHKEIILRDNYRSGSTIVNVAAKMASSYHEVWLNSTKGPGAVWGYEAQTETAESNFIAQNIQTLVIRDKVPYKDIVILIRSWRQRGPIEEALDREGIPYVISDQNREKFFKTKNVLAMVGYLRAIQAIRDSASLGATPDLYGSLDLIINTPPRRGIGPVSQSIILDGQPELGWDQLIKASVNKILRPQVQEEIKNLLQLLINLANKKEVVSPNDLMDHVLQDAGWYESLNDDLRGKENLRNIRALQEKAKAFKNIPDFLHFIRKKTMNDWDGNGVTLSTIHGSKGLEWPVVFLSGFVDGILPSAQSIRSSTAINEEERLAHVAASRAKNLLLISWYRNSRRDDGEGYRAVQPSRFRANIAEGVNIYDKEKFEFPNID
jgi:DNA helicase II / ATP-dependent DNA helicase PcrA